MSKSIPTSKTFINNDFLLENKFSQRLFHDYASQMPIIDYHCHLPSNEIGSLAITRSSQMILQIIALSRTLQKFGLMAIIISGEQCELLVLKKSI